MKAITDFVMDALQEAEPDGPAVGPDGPTNEPEDPSTGAPKELPSLDSTGKVHGDLPEPGVLGRYSPEELRELQGELKQSVQERIRKTVEKGRHRPHGQRQAAEQKLIRQIDKHLEGR